jgi:CheY-like chemotaxis protein
MNKPMLLVDDEVTIRELLAQYLTRTRYRVTAVGTSQEAEKILAGVLFDPDVIASTISNKVSAYFQKTTPLSQILQ